MPDSIVVRAGAEEIVLRKVSPAHYGFDYPDYYMSETEVTNAQFKEYLNDTEQTKDDTNVLRIVREREERRVFSTGDISYQIKDGKSVWRNGEYPRGLSDHPVTLVTLPDATRFCEWLTQKNPDSGIFRLPAWNEWMVAAYGGDRNYPWGEEWSAERVHMSYGFEYPDLPTRTEAVMARPDGMTPEGLYGMLGNVSVFIVGGDPTDDDYFNLGARWMGGGFTQGTFSRGNGRVRFRQDYWGYSHHSSLQVCDLGFRIVLDPQGDHSLLKRPRLFPQENGSWTISPPENERDMKAEP